MISARTIRAITTGVLIALVLLTRQYATKQKSAQQESPTPTVADTIVPNGLVLITKVVDGDTVEIEGGARVRLIGIDTPETVDPRKPVQCFGLQASDYTKSLLAGVAVKLEKDIEDKHKYNRLLRYIYLADGTFINLKLVADGYASAYPYPPNIAHAVEFREAQANARESKLGLWGMCK